MTSLLSVNLSVKSPRKKSFKISETLRSLLPTHSNNSQQSVCTNDHRQQQQQQLEEEQEYTVEKQQQPHTSVSCLAKGEEREGKVGKKSSRNSSSQTSAKSSHREKKQKKIKSHGIMRVDENHNNDDGDQLIEWVIPEYVNDQHPHRQHRSRYTQRRGKEKESHPQGMGDRLTSTETGGDSPVAKNNNNHDTLVDVQAKLLSKKQNKLKVVSHPSFYTHSNNRTSRNNSCKKKRNRIKPSSRTSTPVKKFERNEKIQEIISALTRNCNEYREEIQNLEEKSSNEILKLGNENEELQLLVCKLQHDVDSWKAKCIRQENRNVTIAKLKILTKENQNLKDDAEVLKSVIRRLNKEMGYYQEKLRSRYKGDNIPFYSSSNSNGDGDTDDPENNRWLKDSRVKLQPLLIAYDEIIEEKNEIIKDYEVAMDKFKQKCHAIVRENESLHKVIAEGKQKGSVSYEEWKILYENAVLVLEENDLLHEQISTLKRKAEVIRATQEERESKLQLKVSLLEEERSKIKIVTTQMDNHCKMLTEQNSKLAQAVQSRIPVEEHEASVRECKRLFEDLKKTYAQDRADLTEKLAAVDTEKQRLVVEVADLHAENANLLGKIKDLESSLANNHAKLKEMFTKMEDTSKAKEATAKTVGEMMDLAKTVVMERESLEQSLYEQKNLNVKMMNIRSQESELVNELRGKIKMMEDTHQVEVQRLVHKIKDMEKLLDTIGERHRGDTVQLKELIQEKSKHIEMLQAEKSQLTNDLETVWRATTSSRK